MCPQKALPAVNLGQGEQDLALRQELGDPTGAPAANTQAFPGALSVPRHPLSPRLCPRRPLTPIAHLHPAISGPLPPWGWDTWGRGASKWPKLRETRRTLHPVPPTAKIPVFPSVKGIPFTDGRTHPRKGRVPREELGTRGWDGGRPRLRARWSMPGRAAPMPTDWLSRGHSSLHLA